MRRHPCTYVDKLAKRFPSNTHTRLQYNDADSRTGHGIQPWDANELDIRGPTIEYTTGETDQRDHRGESIDAVVPSVRL